ncbi:MAG: hypothetical protein LC745_02695 [Planctomycetia bacterium]|nr:hypothetical protein [Planctomycetia bacterium]
MNPSQSSKRRRRETTLAPESLETRDLMTGGMGNTIAVIPGSVTKANQTAAIHFTIDPAHFTLPKGKFMLGIDIAAPSGSTLKPQIASVSNPNGSNDPVVHSRYAAGLPSGAVAAGATTTAVLAPVHWNHKNPNGSVTYTVNVRGLKGSTGAFLVGFYLPGNAGGGGTVTQADLKTIQSELGVNASSTKYTFDADANRDGHITPADVSIAKQNMGVSTTIVPTASSHLDEIGQSMPNSRVLTVPTAHFTGTATPGSTVKYMNTSGGVQALSASADSKGNYGITVPLSLGNNTFKVTTSDAFGQSISGTIAPVTYAPNALPPTATNVAPAVTGAADPTGEKKV